MWKSLQFFIHNSFYCTIVYFMLHTLWCVRVRCYVYFLLFQAAFSSVPAVPLPEIFPVFPPTDAWIKMSKSKSGVYKGLTGFICMTTLSVTAGHFTWEKKSILFFFPPDTMINVHINPTSKIQFSHSESVYIDGWGIMH